MRPKEDAYTELHRIVNVLRNSCLDVLEGYDTEHVIRIVRACRASDWDITPCMLYEAEIRFASNHGRLSEQAVQRLKEKHG